MSRITCLRARWTISIMEEARVLHWAVVLPGSHPEATMTERVAADLKAATSGGVEIQVFPGGQLGSSRDTSTKVRPGLVMG